MTEHYFIDDLKKTRENSTEIIALSRDHPIVRAHLIGVKNGDYDYITSLEKMVIDFATSNKSLAEALFKSESLNRSNQWLR